MKKKIKPLDVWLLSAGVVIISFILPLRTVFSNIKTTKKKTKKKPPPKTPEALAGSERW